MRPKSAEHLRLRLQTNLEAYLQSDPIKDVACGAGFSDVGATGARLAEADVREAPGHEIA